MESNIRVMSHIRTSAALHNWRFLLCAVLGVLAALFAGVSQGPLHGHLATWEHSTPASVNSVQAESTVIASQHHSATTADSSQCSTCLDGASTLSTALCVLALLLVTAFRVPALVSTWRKKYVTRILHKIHLYLVHVYSRVTPLAFGVCRI